MNSRNLLILLLVLAALAGGASLFFLGPTQPAAMDEVSRDIPPPKATPGTATAQLTASKVEAQEAKPAERQAASKVAVPETPQDDAAAQFENKNVQIALPELATLKDPKAVLNEANPLGGGDAAKASYFKSLGTTERAARLEKLESAITQFPDGEPSDKDQAQRYADLKSELLWLRAHPKP